MIEKRLGKITKARYGHGGYQDAQFGLSLSFESGCLATSDFKGTWSASIECTEHCKWTEADRSRQNDETARFIDKLLIDAKVGDVSKLVGIPVELEFDSLMLKGWRILTEVL